MPEKKTKIRKAVAAIVVRELLIALGFSLDNKNLNKADAGINKFKAGAESALAAVGRMAAVVGVALGATEIVQMADAWTNVDSRIGLVTKSTAEQAEMQQKVFEIAQKTRQEYGATGDLFFKLSQSSDQLGASAQDILDVTETVNKALVIGGADTATAKATILQLSQALASGRLQGDELRSLGENASMLMREVAKAYGVTVGQLKQLGADGELTAEGVFKAILKAKAKMDKEFEKMPVTIEQSVTYALNRIGKLIFNLNKETSVFQYIAKAIIKAADGIANSIDKGIKKLGGWNSAVKIATTATIAFGAAIIALRWDAIIAGILAIRRALLALNFNPVALVIAGSIAILIVALQDLYVWANNGKSIFGEMVGEFSRWESTITPIVNGLSRLNEEIYSSMFLLGKLFPNIDFVKASLDIFIGLVEYSLWPLKAFLIVLKSIEVVTTALKNMFELIVPAINNMGNSLEIVWGKLNKIFPSFNGFGNFGISPSSMAGSYGSSIINQTNNVEINQANSGISSNQARDVGAATGQATTDAMGAFTRGVENMIYAYP